MGGRPDLETHDAEPGRRSTSENVGPMRPLRKTQSPPLPLRSVNARRLNPRATRLAGSHQEPKDDCDRYERWSRSQTRSEWRTGNGARAPSGRCSRGLGCDRRVRSRRHGFDRDRRAPRSSCAGPALGDADARDGQTGSALPRPDVLTFVVLRIRPNEGPD